MPDMKAAGRPSRAGTAGGSHVQTAQLTAWPGKLGAAGGSGDRQARPVVACARAERAPVSNLLPWNTGFHPAGPKPSPSVSARVTAPRSPTSSLEAGEDLGGTVHRTLFAVHSHGPFGAGEVMPSS